MGIDFSSSSKVLSTIVGFVSDGKMIGSMSPVCAEGSNFAGTEKITPGGMAVFPPQIATVKTPSGCIASLHLKFC